MAESQAPAAPGRADGRAEPNHGLRILLIWVVLALAADLLIWFAWYPHMPPGDMSSSARHQQFDIAVLALAAAPVMLFVWIYFGYTLVNWRHRDGDDDDGPPIFGHTGGPGHLDRCHRGDRAGRVRVRHRGADRPGGRGRRAKARCRSGSLPGTTCSRFR